MIFFFYLFVLFDFGFMMLKNCVLMGLMYIGFEDSCKMLLCFVEYFVECVCGGVGLIVMGGFVLNVVGWIKLFGGMLMMLVVVCWYCEIIGVVYVEDGKIVL